jgi:hypothetical protein
VRKRSEEVENKPSKVATYRSTKRARQKKTTEGVRKQDAEERKRVQVDMERRRTEHGRCGQWPLMMAIVQWPQLWPTMAIIARRGLVDSSVICRRVNPS